MRHEETTARVGAADDHKTLDRLRGAVRDLFGLKWWPAFEATARDRGWLRAGAILPADAEIARGVEATLPKETALFRHAAHWPAIRATGAKNVWSAGCATGEEAISIAMVLPAGSVFATDVAASALHAAKSGFVRRAQIDRLSPEDRRLFKADGRVSADVMGRITFQIHNLARNDYPTGFDLIVCRNVLVYMVPECKRRVVAGFAEALGPGGLLLLGSVDRASPLPEGLRREERNGVVFLRRS